MDFGLYVRVLWRFRLLVVLGLILALSLAMLSFVRVGTDGVTYRQTELWASTTRLLVTQTGFPEGRLYGADAHGRRPADRARRSSTRDVSTTSPSSTRSSRRATRSAR